MEHIMTDEEWEAPLDAETEAQIAKALTNARSYYPHEVATTVRFLASEDLLLIVMKSGQRVAIPIENIQDLADADRQAVADFELIGSGYALHWEKLDADHRTQDLAQGFYGNDHWMKRLHEKWGSNVVDSSTLPAHPGAILAADPSSRREENAS